MRHKFFFLIDESGLNELRLRTLTFAESVPCPQDVATFGGALARGPSPALTVGWNDGRRVVRLIREAIDERCHCPPRPLDGVVRVCRTGVAATMNTSSTLGNASYFWIVICKNKGVSSAREHNVGAPDPAW